MPDDNDIHDELDALALEVEETIQTNRERMREMGVTPPQDQGDAAISTEELLQETHEILDERV